MISSIACLSSSMGKQRIVFGGGPVGGTFQTFANAIQMYEPVKEIEGFVVKAQSSAGSIENLRKVESGKHDFSIVYSGHVYLGQNGHLKNDTKKYENVMTVAHLYSAPAQLVAKKGLGIRNVKDLIGKRVGVGNAGSGAFANCEMFFTHLGIWDKIERNALGYNDAANAFGNNQLDAFWLFTAFPSSAVIMAAQTNDIDLIDLGQEARGSGYLMKYPYFKELSIPRNTYKGVSINTDSFSDSALWVANSNVPDDVVYELLSKVFTDEGFVYMIGQKKNFDEMRFVDRVKDMVNPIHPGAVKFWREKGIL